jgi:hypothetical protein
MASNADLHLRLNADRKDRFRKRTAHLSGGMTEALDHLVRWYLREPGVTAPARPPLPEDRDPVD